MPVAGVQWNHRFVIGRPQWAPLARTERSRRNGQNAPLLDRMIQSFWNAPAAAHRRVDQSCWLGVATWLTLWQQGAGGSNPLTPTTRRAYCSASTAARSSTICAARTEVWPTVSAGSL